MTNRERAAEWYNADSTDSDIDALAELLDAAEKRGELRGRIAELKALAARVPPGESGELAISTHYLFSRLAQLRAELEKSNG